MNAMNSIRPSISFKGSAVCATKYDTIGATKPMLQREVKDSWQKEIDYLEACKQFALTFDNLMRTDKDIKKAISETPYGFKIKWNAQCVPNPHDSSDHRLMIDYINPYLSVKYKGKEFGDDGRYDFSFKEDGTTREEIKKSIISAIDDMNPNKNAFNEQ